MTKSFSIEKKKVDSLSIKLEILLDTFIFILFLIFDMNCSSMIFLRYGTYQGRPRDKPRKTLGWGNPPHKGSH